MPMGRRRRFEDSEPPAVMTWILLVMPPTRGSPETASNAAWLDLPAHREPGDAVRGERGGARSAVCTLAVEVGPARSPRALYWPRSPAWADGSGRRATSAA